MPFTNIGCVLNISIFLSDVIKHIFVNHKTFSAHSDRKSRFQM